MRYIGVLVRSGGGSSEAFCPRRRKATMATQGVIITATSVEIVTVKGTFIAMGAM